MSSFESQCFSVVRSKGSRIFGPHWQYSSKAGSQYYACCRYVKPILFRFGNHAFSFAPCVLDQSPFKVTSKSLALVTGVFSNF